MGKITDIEKRNNRLAVDENPLGQAASFSL